MIKKYFIVALFFLFIPIANSQTFHWGIKGGVLSSYHSVSNSSENKVSRNRIGWLAGVYTNIKLGENFRIEPELYYVSKGAEMERSIIGSEVNYSNTELDYISIPLNSQIGLSYDNFFIYVLIGPRVDISVGENENGLSGIYKNRNNFNFGGNIGFGFWYSKSNKKQFGVELRYSPDLSTFPVEGFSVNGIHTSYINGTNFRTESLELHLNLGLK